MTPAEKLMKQVKESFYSVPQVNVKRMDSFIYQKYMEGQRSHSELGNQERSAEMASDYLAMILSSERLKGVNFAGLQVVMRAPKARKYFALNMFQDKFKDRTPHKLGEEAFEDMYKLVVCGLLESNNMFGDFEDQLLMTKSLFFYFKLGENGMYFLVDKIKENKFSVGSWKEEGFWRKWMEFDLVNVINKGMKTEEEVYFKTLVDMSLAMVGLRLDLNTIENILIEQLAEKYLKNVFL